MARLVPAIHALQNRPMRQGYVYFPTNKPNGILYVGVTSNLARRIHEHRIEAVDGFTKRYGLKRLVYFEVFGRHSDRHSTRAQYQTLEPNVEGAIDFGE